MMRNTYTYLFLAVTLFSGVLFSCSSDAGVEGKEYELLVSVEKPADQVPSSRIGLDGKSFASGDKFKIYFFSGEPVTDLTTGVTITEYEYASSKWSVASGKTPIYWDDQDRTKPRSFCAVMPYENYSVDNRSFAVQTNQSTSGNYIASDLLIARTKTNARMIPVNFRHVFSRLIVKFETPDASNNFGTIAYAEVKINQVKQTGKIKYNELTEGTGLGPQVDVEAEGTSDITLYKADANTFYAILPPQDILKGADNKLLTFKITEDGVAKTYNYWMTDDKISFVQGKQITITLKLSKTGVELASPIGITGWGDIEGEDDDPIKI